MPKVNIALVDDEQSFHTLFKLNFKKQIKKDEVKIYNFEAGEEFLKFLEDNSEQIKIIILISDINMPGMNGLQLCEIIRDKYPSIEVYIASAYANEDYKHKAESVGAKAFFSKPIDFSDVNRVVDEKLKQVS